MRNAPVVTYALREYAMFDETKCIDWRFSGEQDHMGSLRSEFCLFCLPQLFAGLVPLPACQQTGETPALPTDPNLKFPRKTPSLRNRAPGRLVDCHRSNRFARVQTPVAAHATPSDRAAAGNFIIGASIASVIRWRTAGQPARGNRLS